MPSEQVVTIGHRCPAWRVWVAVFALLIADGVVGKLFGIVVRGHGSNDAPRHLFRTASTAGFGSVATDLAVHWLPRVAIIGLVTALMLRFIGLDWRDALSRWRVPRLSTCALVAAAVTIYHVGVRWAIGGWPLAIADGLATNPIWFCGVYVLRFLPSAVAEEVVYRGGLIGILGARYGAAFAAGLSLVLFVVGHSYGGWWLMVNAVALGAMFTVIYTQTGSLAPGVVAHTFSNVVHASLNY